MILANFEPITQINPLLAISIIFICGHFLGRLFSLIKVPGITGQIIAGIVLGPSFLHFFNHDTTVSLLPITTFAMGLVTFTVGIHLDYRKIHNALERILLITICESILVFSITFILLLSINVAPPLALMLSAIAISTAPATILAVVRENRAKGAFIKTLLAVVAFDNIICIVAFTIAQIIAFDMLASKELFIHWEIAKIIFQLSSEIFLGIASGVVINFAMRKKILSTFSLLIVGIITVLGICQHFGLSPLLANLALGTFLVNYSSLTKTNQVVDEIEHIDELIFTCFFTIAGVNLHLYEISKIGLIGLVYFSARVLGKYIGCTLGAHFSKCVPRIKWNIGYSLIPQAGLANGLILVLAQNKAVPEKDIILISTAVLGCIAINEIVGPLFTSKAIKNAKEKDKDYPKLIEFLEEEFIITNLKAKDKWDAIEQLTKFLALTHRIKSTEIAEILESINKREKELPAIISPGIAVPNGKISKIVDIQGVLGISKDGIIFDENEPPVHLIFFLVTPHNLEKKYLQILSSIAKIVRNDTVYHHLCSAKTPAQAHEIIRSEEIEVYNYFLDKDENI